MNKLILLQIRNGYWPMHIVLEREIIKIHTDYIDPIYTFHMYYIPITNYYKILAKASIIYKIITNTLRTH